MATLQEDQDWQLSKKTVLERNIHMFNNSFMSDIKFTCGEAKEKYFFAHKYVLGTSSPVFHAMFYGVFAETGSVIHLPDTDDESMEEFLRFLYTDECSLTLDNAVNLIYLANKYMITTLTEKCVAVLETNVKPDNVFHILEQVKELNMEELEEICWDVICGRTSASITSPNFADISKSSLDDLLKKEALNVKEIDLFKAVLEWSDKQCSNSCLETTTENRREALGGTIHRVRFLAMSQEQFAQHVSPSKLLTAEEMIPIYEKFNGVQHATTPQFPLAEKRGTYIPTATENFQRFALFTVADLNSKDPTMEISSKFLAKVYTNSKEPFIFHGVSLYEWNGEVTDIMLKVNGKEIEDPIHVPRKGRNDIMVPWPGHFLSLNLGLGRCILNVHVKITGVCPTYYGIDRKLSEDIDGLGNRIEWMSSRDFNAENIKEIMLSKS